MGVRRLTGASLKAAPRDASSVEPPHDEGERHERDRYDGRPSAGPEEDEAEKGNGHSERDQRVTPVTARGNREPDAKEDEASDDAERAQEPLAGHEARIPSSAYTLMESGGAREFRSRARSSRAE